MSKVTLAEFDRYEEEIRAELAEAGIGSLGDGEYDALEAFHAAWNEEHPGSAHPSCTCRSCILERRTRVHFGLGEQEYAALLDRSMRRWIRERWPDKVRWPAELDEEDARLDALDALEGS